MGQGGEDHAEAKAILEAEWASLDLRKKSLQRTRHKAFKEGRETKLIDRMISRVHKRRDDVKEFLNELEP